MRALLVVLALAPWSKARGSSFLIECVERAGSTISGAASGEVRGEFSRATEAKGSRFYLSFDDKGAIMLGNGGSTKLRWHKSRSTSRWHLSEFTDAGHIVTYIFYLKTGVLFQFKSYDWATLRGKSGHPTAFTTAYACKLAK